ncbi:type II restriction endonuclease [Stenotrophomonas geniculata]|uniref:type II restriction endonuclease n=1 Tax=Stenotrophomonas geniculata TaxID=86188 RepID=UPI0029490B3A|nr:type II restriction endonuclease [Stenotrophomonas geniculata]MDV6188601.1 type II restriction endonuclease [Stenotrophomonas geniculata]
MDFLEQSSDQWSLMESFVNRSGKLFLKKLSRNDASWANEGGGHQYGFYVPRAVRESGFFPELHAREDIPHILEADCPSFWPQTGEVRSDSGIKYYSNKGSECHFTRIPAELFAGLNPASWLLGGTLEEPEGNAYHWFMVIDSASTEAEMLESRLDIQANFHFDLLDPSKFKRASAIESDEAADLISEIDAAIRTGTIETLVAKYSKLPDPPVLADEARLDFLRSVRSKTFNPWDIKKPGDALMRVSRDIEFSIYRRHELRMRAVEVARVLAQHDRSATAAVRGFASLNSIFLSASQQRKSRAGKSFETHLAAMLKAGGVRFEAQAILGQRRPDFVLPDQATVALDTQRRHEDAAILSAKTTLRERWKQITHERFNCAIFLATVDDRVSKEALADLQKAEITLVVPESLKMKTNESLYYHDTNVISFRQFFDEELARKRPTLLLAG